MCILSLLNKLNASFYNNFVLLQRNLLIGRQRFGGIHAKKRKMRGKPAFG